MRVGAPAGSPVSYAGDGWVGTNTRSHGRSSSVAERRPCNSDVGGSIPSCGSTALAFELDFDVIERVIRKWHPEPDPPDDIDDEDDDDDDEEEECSTPIRSRTKS